MLTQAAALAGVAAAHSFPAWAAAATVLGAGTAMVYTAATDDEAVVLRRDRLRGLIHEYAYPQVA